MATTTNYGWTTPDDTALVKDGAAAIRSLGSAIDTTTKNLNPGTTNGDIDYYATGTTKSRVAIGSSGQCLTVVAGVPSWAASATSILTTTGDLLYASAANTLARRAIGSTGDVLTVSGGLPTWAAPAAGGMTLISTTTLTGASVTLSSIPSTYVHLQLIFRNFRPATANADIIVRANSDANSRYQTTGGGGTISENSGNYQTGFTTDRAYRSNGSSSALEIWDFFNYANTVTWKLCQGTSVYQSALTNPTLYMFTSMYNQTTAISSLQILPTSGNFTSGEVLLYGVK